MAGRVPKRPLLSSISGGLSDPRARQFLVLAYLMDRRGGRDQHRGRGDHLRRDDHASPRLDGDENRTRRGQDHSSHLRKSKPRRSRSEIIAQKVVRGRV